MIGITINDNCQSSVTNYSSSFEMFEKTLRSIILEGGLKIPPRNYTNNTFRGMTTIKLFSGYLNNKISFIEFIYYFTHHAAYRFSNELIAYRYKFSKSEKIVIIESFKKFEKQALDYDYIEALNLKNLSAEWLRCFTFDFNSLVQNILISINRIIYEQLTLTENFKSYRNLQIIQLGTTSQKMIEELEKQTYDKFIYQNINN